MPALTDNMRGALLMVGSMTAFTFNDACMKALSDELPLMQALFLRGMATSALIYLFLQLTGRFDLNIPRRDWGIIGLRTLGEIAAAYFFLTALFNMPFANVSAILQALPLTITLAGALFLGEAVGWRRLVAILIGFGGVMLIVRPGGEGFNVYSLYVVAAVFAVALRDLCTRRLSPSVPSMSVALITALAVGLAAGLASVFEGWAPVSGRAAMQLAGSAIFVMGGYLLSIMVMRTGEIGFVAPFRYTSLVVALILGYAIFDEWPDNLTLLGAGIVVATGLFTLYREHRLTRARLRHTRAEEAATG
ncbi:DMT family transporter [Palleronia sp. KMU-117]|uniref:DMT family transporter n=1 Tax=Palleronia sp. KMU-117 TaxID=3434108 RepID=UPI003D75ACCD